VERDRRFVNLLLFGGYEVNYDFWYL